MKVVILAISWKKFRGCARGTRFFRVQIFRGSPLDHENHENITPRKIPAIRYVQCEKLSEVQKYMYMYISKIKCEMKCEKVREVQSE